MKHGLEFPIRFDKVSSSGVHLALKEHEKVMRVAGKMTCSGISWMCSYPYHPCMEYKGIMVLKYIHLHLGHFWGAWSI